LKKLFLLISVFALALTLAACGGDDEALECTAPQVLNEAGDACEDPAPLECTAPQVLNEAGDACVDPAPLECTAPQVLNEAGDACVDPVVNEAPSIAGAADAFLTVGDSFDPLAGITATDPEDGDITADIVLSGSVDTMVIGSYTLTYTVEDSEGEEVSVTRTVDVSDIEAIYPTGFYNYKFANTEIRHTFMAAAEKYLLNNMYAGVPLFANGSFALYSWRLQLPGEEYVPVMGYGNAFGSMSADDSAVFMQDGEYGNAGEYTYRTTISINPVTFNQWLADDASTSDIIDQFSDSLYSYVFNADKSGYEVVPSMAAANPVPVESRITDTGKEVANKWQIQLKDGLTWTYHADTDLTNLPAGHEVLDMNDFMATFQHAVDEEWFRAISGGGDFLTSSQEIKGMADYVDGLIEWEEVGITLVDDLTIEFDFVNEMSDWNVRYWLSSTTMTPINMELYFELGDDTYATSETTTAYHGAYKLDYYEADKVLEYSKNPNFHSPELYFYTGYSYAIIETSEVRFQEFMAGKLEGVALPSTEYESYKNYPGIRQIPGATTFRIMINGLETVEAQREAFPDGAWEPEPILANQDFKMAMFHALDRQKLAEEVLKTSTTNMYLFSNAYLVDAELGIPYRQTAQGQTVGEGLSPSTHGFNFDAAQAYFKLATAALVADGTLAAGTAEAPTVIEVDFHIFSGSESQELMGAYIEQAFEDAFVDDVNNIEFDLVVKAKDFPGIYYDYMMIGEFDLSIGGISGSTLDAASFLDTYSSDNRSGFTLNWGIDTSVAEIEVNYADKDGVVHKEIWSFDAIVSALNGEIFLSEGAEADAPKIEGLTHTPTTLEFDVTKFDTGEYVDFTYTLYYYDLAAGYLVVEGHEDVAITDAHVMIDGLTPGYEPSTYYNYLGDYEVHISYKYASDTEKSGSYAAPWWLNTAAATGEVTAAVDSASIVVTVNEDDYARVLTGAVVLDGTGTAVAGAAVDFSDLAAVAVTGLVAETTYFVELTFDDGHIAVIEFTTLAAS
jgi:ABC-type oligopeptide transport system substrate-binding subunit